MKIRTLLILCFLLGSLLAIGQEVVINSRLLSVSDGMVGRNARAVATDQASNVWIATDLGVSVFDGIGVSTPEGLPDEISHGRFDDIYCTADGMLWFLESEFLADQSKSFIKKLFTYDPIKKKKVALYTASLESLQIKADKTGGLWIWNNENEIYHYRNSLRLVQKVETKFLVSIEEVNNRIFYFYTKKIVEYREGQLQQTILSQYRIGITFQSEIGNIYLKYYKLFWEEKGVPIVGRLDLQNYSISDTQMPLKEVRDFGYQDSQIMEFSGLISFFVNNYIFLLDPIDLNLISKEKLLQFERPISFYGGVNPQKGQFYIATSEGLLMTELFLNKVKNYFEEESFSLRGIGALNQNELLINTYSGVKILNRHSGKYSNLVTKDISLFGTADFSDSELISGTHGNNYSIFNKNTKQIVSESVSISGVNCILLLPERLENEELWMGSSCGPYKYDFQENKFVKPLSIANSSLDKLTIRSISFQEGRYYFCTEDGLYVAEENLVPQFDEQIGNEIITDLLLEDSYQWISTFGKGLIRRDTRSGKLRYFNSASVGFSNDYIYSIQDDDLGYIWLPTNNGLLRFDKSTFDFEIFSTQDGFANYEYNNASSFVDETGRMFFGGTDGLSSFHPKDFTTDRDTVEFEVANMQYIGVDGSAVLLQEKKMESRIDLPANYLSYSFSIHSENYALEENIKYIYKIPNYSNEWQAIDNNKLTLNRLPFGNHSILVKPLVSGHRKASLIVIPLNVSAPFYFKPPFLISIALGLIALTILYIRWRTNQLRNRNLLLSRQVKARTMELSTRNKDLTEINDTRDRLFGIIAHDLRGPLIGFKDLGEKIKFLKEKNREADLERLTNTVQENYENLTTLLNNLLNWISAQRGRLPINIEPLLLDRRIDETLRLYDQTIKQKEIRIIKEGPKVYLMADEDALDILLRNLINNAIKYSEPKGRIWISSFENGKEASLVIEDEGMGIGEDEVKNLFQVKARRGRQGTRGEKSTGLGLPLCKEFVQLMNGRIEVKSELGKGTRIVVSLPKHASKDKKALMDKG